MGKAVAVYAITLAACFSATPLRAQDCPVPESFGLELSAAQAATDTLELTAGSADLDAYGLSQMSGGVELRYADKRLLTEKLSYDQPSRQVRVDTAVQYSQTGTQLSAAQAELNLDDGQLAFEQTRFVLQGGGNGSAERFRVDTSGTLHLYEVRYTTCPGENPPWALGGKQIDIDAKKGQGTARNIWLRFFDVPLLYVPWFRFPVGPARQSGLLFPRVGTSDSTGTFVRWPLYLNLHPQYDLTLTPEQLSERGTGLGVTARGLWHRGRAESAVRWFKRDERSGSRRWRVDTSLQSRLNEDWRAQIEYARVSDIDFLRDLGLEQSDSATNVLERRFDLSWRPRPDLRLMGRVQDFQILDRNSLGTVFSREPEMSLHFSPKPNQQGFRPTIDSQYVRFANVTDSEADRLDNLLGLRWQRDYRGWNANASGVWRHTAYRLADGSRVHRSLPTFRTGVGLKLRRMGRRSIQTLRPRLDYVYTPFREQNDIPVFDTSLPDFSLDQLRSSNRFSGIDRISDENTLIPSLETALLNPLNGIRQARLRVGLQLRLADSRVALPGSGGSTKGNSDWLLETDVDSGRGIRGRAAGQYNTQDQEFVAFNVGGRYRGKKGRQAQLAYRFQRQLFEQVDALALWPVTGPWSMAARWTWAVDARRSIETLAGVSYQSCCWGVTAGVRRYLNGTAEELDTGVFLQLAFSGLGNFGQGFGEFFEQDRLSF